MLRDRLLSPKKEPGRDQEGFGGINRGPGNEVYISGRLIFEMTCRHNYDRNSQYIFNLPARRKAGDLAITKTQTVRAQLCSANMRKKFLLSEYFTSA